MPPWTITAAGSRGCGGLADAVRWSAYGILLLIAGATAAAVSFATRAGLEAHHEMVALAASDGRPAKLYRPLGGMALFRVRLVCRRAGHAVRSPVLPGRQRA